MPPPTFMLGNFGVALSQLLNVALGGSPCETLCARVEGTNNLLERALNLLSPGHVRGTREASRRRAQKYLEK
jgi:hypothetical protein